MNKDIIKPVAIFTGGAGLGYFIAYVVVSKKFQGYLDAETAALKEYYGRTHNKLVFATPGEAVAALHPEQADITTPVTESEFLAEAVQAAKEYAQPDDEEETEEMVTSNIFLSTSQELSDEELNARNPVDPYVVSVGEFMDNDGEFDQVNLTYYEGDNSLCDDQEHLIPDIEGTVSSENLEKFGLASGDANVVYVRNERLKTVFEITRNLGEYAIEVMGVAEDHLEHSAPMRRRDRRSARDD